MRFNKIWFLIVALTFVTSIIKAQNDSTFNKNNISKNVVFVEFLGNGSEINETETIGTINYERVLKEGSKTIYALRAGVGLGNYISTRYRKNNLGTPQLSTGILLMTFINNNNRKHHIEKAIGVILTSDYDYHLARFGLTGSLKYRYQKSNKPGLYFSCGWSPKLFYPTYYDGIIGLFTKGFMLLNTVGLGCGYHF